MDVSADLAEAREKFADDDEFIKTWHPKPSRYDPN